VSGVSESDAEGWMDGCVGGDCVVWGGYERRGEMGREHVIEMRFSATDTNDNLCGGEAGDDMIRVILEYHMRILQGSYYNEVAEFLFLLLSSPFVKRGCGDCG